MLFSLFYGESFWPFQRPEAGDLRLGVYRDSKGHPFLYTSARLRSHELTAIAAQAPKQLLAGAGVIVIKLPRPDQ